jgi:hypothetical protein
MRRIGTTCNGSYPKTNNRGVKPVPKPIPAHESIVSNRNESTITSGIISNI